MGSPLMPPLGIERGEERRVGMRTCSTTFSSQKMRIKEVLPVCAALRKRRIDVEAVCPLCNNVEEMPLPPQVNQTDYGW
nr:hypothetical protein Itr_chr08CG01900 [Ipomoea trifida]